MIAPAAVFAISPLVYWPYLFGVALILLGLFATRRQVSQARGLDKILALNPIFFATPLAVFSAEHLTDAKTIMTLVPVWMPWHLFWAYFVGFALVAAALSIALNVQVRWSGILLGIMFTLFVLMMDIPGVVGSPRDRFAWALAFRELTFASGAFCFAATAMDASRVRGANALVTFGRIVISVAAIFYGVEHFLHPANVPVVPLEKLTPVWIPARLFVAYLTGAALLAAGASMLVGKRARMAATYLGVFILLVVLYIYLPILVASVSAATTSEKIEGVNYFFDTLFFGGTVLALANAIPKSREND